MFWIIRLSGFCLLLVTLLPLLSTGKWYVRVWDFPRLQLSILMCPVISLAIFFLYKSSLKSEARIWIVLLSAALIYQVSHIIPFSPIWAVEVPTAKDKKSFITSMVVNLKVENSLYSEVIKEIAEENPDILLLIEYDENWKSGLKQLHSDFEYHHEVVRGDGLGMALWSHIELQQAETRFVVSERRPSIWAQLPVADSDETINLVCVHPTPPGLKDETGEERRDSRVRDAELILIAKEIAERDDESWIVQGDFNDVAWSHTTRLFKRLSGLKDPRIGRNFMGTYIAQYPPLRCPIDHVFLSDGFTLGELSRKFTPGSDHFAVIAAIALESEDEGVTPEPEGNDLEDSAEIINEGVEEAKERDVKDD